jgi:hypothetical protein
MTYSDKQYNINEITEEINLMEIYDDTSECCYDHIIIFEMKGSIGYMFLDRNRLYYESENGNIKGIRR